jgi:isoleucyl-tRNA synthetase
MAEQIYRNLVLSVDKNAPESVHLCDYPVCDESMICEHIELNMDKVISAVVLGRACRNGANIKNRQPIAKMYVEYEGDDLPESYTLLIAEELNAKACERTYDSSKFVGYKFKPQLKTLGRRYGKLIPAISAHLAAITDGHAVMDAVSDGGVYTFDIEGEKISLEKEDLLIETVKDSGYVSESDKGITVVLDVNLTPELIDEGFVREIVNKLQTMRKEAGFEVMDHIKVSYEASAEVERILASFGADIASDVLAESVEKTAPCGYVKEWDINGEKATFGVEKI